LIATKQIKYVTVDYFITSLTKSGSRSTENSLLGEEGLVEFCKNKKGVLE